MNALTTRLIDDWRKGLKYWSVRLNITGAGISALFLALPDTLTAFWGSFPAEVRALLPLAVLKAIPVALFVAATLARLVKQGKVDA